jgi:hypothetical protein
MRDPNQLLVIPLTFWAGVEQGFFGADFTAVNISFLPLNFYVSPVPLSWICSSK